MTTTSWKEMSTEELNFRRKLADNAVKLVWAGASIAIAAVFFCYFADGLFPATPFYTALVALLASVPVYQEKIQILSELEQRA